MKIRHVEWHQGRRSAKGSIRKSSLLETINKNMWPVVFPVSSWTLADVCWSTVWSEDRNILWAGRVIHTGSKGRVNTQDLHQSSFHRAPPSLHTDALKCRCWLQQRASCRVRGHFSFLCDHESGCINVLVPIGVSSFTCLDHCSVPPEPNVENHVGV